jgi:D-alanyl-D-alanine carboxypeptidase
MKRKTLFITLMALAVLTVGHAQALDKAKLDQYFDKLAEKNKAMGSVTIAKDGNVLYTRAIGYSQINGTEKKPLTGASRFRIGSITKMFTAAMVLQLVEEGKLKLTDNLSTFLPQVPNASNITILQILSHRSGIPNIKRDPQRSSGSPITKDEMLGLIVKETPDFEPDTKHLYSNSGYFILGLILEKLSGKPYGEVLAERITAKIGLRDTYVAIGSIDVNNNESLTYFRLGNEWKPGGETHPSLLFSAGAIVSTPNDMAKFIQALFDGKLITQQSLDQMITLRDGEGLGMDSFKFAGKTFYGHTGGADNYGAWLAYLPDEKLAVAYTTNAKVYPVGNILNGIIDIYYNRPFLIPSFEVIEVSPEVLDKYVGVYSSPDAPVKFTISRKGTTLYVQPGTESAAPFEAIAQDKFQIEGAVIIEFDVAKKQMTVRRRGGERIFTKEN